MTSPMDNPALTEYVYVHIDPIIENGYTCLWSGHMVHHTDPTGERVLEYADRVWDYRLGDAEIHFANLNFLAAQDDFMRVSRDEVRAHRLADGNRLAGTVLGALVLQAASYQFAVCDEYWRSPGATLQGYQRHLVSGAYRPAGVHALELSS